MAKQILRLNNFSGGLSDDDKFGPQNSFAEGQGIDFRKSPGLLTLQKELFPESTNGASDGVVTTEVSDAVRDKNGNTYFAGRAKLYKRAVSVNAGYGLYTSIAASDVTDLVYLENLDAILCIGSYYISEYSNVTTSPVFNLLKYGQFNMLDQQRTGGTYTVPTAISEAAADTFPFVCTAEPLYGTQMNINTKGAGGTNSLILTVHDSANNVVLTETRTNASIPASGDMPSFFWDGFGAGRLKVGQSYHVHVTSVAAGFKLTTGVLNTLTDMDITIYAYRLVPITTGFGHRAMQVGAKIFICNERYLAEWEVLNTAAGNADGYIPNRLGFPGNFVTNGLAEYNEYLAIGCAIKNGSDSLDTLGSEGMIFLWDMVSTNYNVAIPVPQGVPNSLISYRNALYWETKGRWYRWAGGDIETVYEFPDIDQWQAADNAPQSEVYLRAAGRAMTVWNSLLMIGFPYQTANLNTKYGIYSFGKKKSSAPDAIGYDYVPFQLPGAQVQFTSSGTPTTPVTAITLVKAFGSNLFVGYKVRPTPAGGTEYYIDFTNDAQGYREVGSWASMWYDAGTPDKEKTFMSVVITCKPLPTNSTLTPKVRFNRDTAWRTDADAFEVAGGTIVRLTLPVESSRWREVQIGFDLTNDSTTGDAPEIVSVSLEYDDNADEDNTGESV